MHPAVFKFVAESLKKLPPRKVVLEYGGRNINGSVKRLFPDVVAYTSIDLMPGPGVDVVADATTYIPTIQPDTIICCEVLEHTSMWPFVVKAAGRHLRKDSGVLLLTCACEPRAPHSGVDGGAVQHHEFYKNVDPMVLTSILDQAGFVEYELEVDDKAGDLRLLAWTYDPSRADALTPGVEVQQGAPGLIK